MDAAFVVEWLNLVLRWAHMIVGIAWIGASFYFIWLDNHLREPLDPADAAKGIGGGSSCIGALFLNGGSLAPSSAVLDVVPALGSDSVGSGFTPPSSSSSLLLSCAIAPSMPDASPVSSI
jgi:hypothetical protein